MELFTTLIAVLIWPILVVLFFDTLRRETCLEREKLHWSRYEPTLDLMQNESLALDAPDYRERAVSTPGIFVVHSNDTEAVPEAKAAHARLKALEPRKQSRRG